MSWLISAIVLVIASIMGISSNIADYLFAKDDVTMIEKPMSLDQTKEFANTHSEEVVRPWWKDAVIYQVYVRSFQDSNDDGIGDLPGLISRLDYLNDGTSNSLGVNVLWLSPVTVSPDVDFGYDVADYKSIDPKYGSMHDFETLIDECNKRGIRVMMDLVVNHTSDQHPWFIESRSSRDNPKRDWYLWRDGENGLPNNWRSRVDQVAWEYDEKTSQYYHHSFFKEQPDLNWRNPEVRAEIDSVMRFWLDKGVRGFRLDLANYYLKDAEFRSNPFQFKWTGLGYRYHFQEHLYDKDLLEVVSIFQHMREIADEYDAVLLGEIDTDDDAAKKVALCADEKSRALHLGINFELVSDDVRFEKNSLHDVFNRWIETLPVNAQQAYSFSNHDRVRHFTRFGNDVEKARLIAMMLMTMKNTPIIYYGEEIGMKQAAIPRSEVKDPLGHVSWIMWMINLGRDGCRTPMQWDSNEFAGFSTSKPWLPLSHNYDSINVEDEQNDANSLLNFYRKMVWFRKQNPILLAGEQSLRVNAKNSNVFMFERRLDNQVWTILLNMSSKREHVNFTDDKEHECILSSHGFCDEKTKFYKNFALEPYEGIILK